MKLLSLYIEEYKNIKKQTFDFSNHDGLTLLVGNNGSGKSNLLESISDIFSNLFQGYTNFKTEGFDIKYKFSTGVTYSIKYASGVLEKKINGELETSTSPIVLPKRLVAIYSGETTRLWDDFYKPIYSGLVRNQIHVSKKNQYSLSLRLPEMIYLNHFYWDLSLLSLLCSEAEDIKSFCCDEIGIKGNALFKFKYATQEGYNGYHNYTNSRILDFVRSFDSKEEYTIDEFVKVIEDNGFYRSELFELLYCAYTPKDGKIITDIKIIFNNDLTVDDLSEGLKKRLLIRAALEFAAHEDSLYLLDEPDAHIHLNKKKSIIGDIGLYKTIKQFIITSHSPTMCKCVGKDNPNSIIMLDDGKRKSVNGLFETGRLLSDDDEVFNLLFTTKHIVLTEGKTDCKYIEKAISLFKNEYPLLYNDVEFISVGGTDGDVVCDLLPRITDLVNRKIIVLVDRDKGGLNCARNVFNNENLGKNDVDIKKIDYKSNSFFIMIPSIDGTQKDFTIEDYFNHDTIQSLSIDYIKTKFSGKNFTEFPKVKDDLKKNILPDFSNSSTNPDEFVGFKVLLDKLTICLNSK